MTAALDIVIIGGGVSGLLTARELQLAGRAVTVIDQSSIGSESSWAGGGILLPLYPWRQPAAISALVHASLSCYPQLQQRLLNDTGIDPEWQPCGLLLCHNPDHTAASAWCQHYDIVRQAPPPELFAALQTDWLAPFWLPDIAQVRNPRLLKALKQDVQQRGGVLLEHATVTAIEQHQQRINHISVNQQRFSVNEVVVCAGAWTAAVLERWLPMDTSALPIAPVKGQMLVFDAEPTTLSTMVLAGDRYLIPRRDGKILAGSTVEHAGFDKTTTAAAAEQLYHFATALLPALRQYPVSHHWAGLRPGSPTGVPFIGRHPQLHNLSINAGHFRNGLVMGPASAALMADLLLNRRPLLDPSPYAIPFASAETLL